VARAVVDFLEMVDVSHQHGHRRLAAARPLELEIELFAKAPPVGELGQGIGAGGVVELTDQQLDSLAHALNQDRRDKERAHANDPPGGNPARRRSHGQEHTIGDPDVGDLGSRLLLREEVGRVEEDPEIEEDQGTGILPGEERDSGDQGAAPCQCDWKCPARDTSGSREQDNGDHVGVPDDDEQPELAGLLRMGKQNRQQRQRRAGSKQARQSLRHQADLEARTRAQPPRYANALVASERRHISPCRLLQAIS